MSWLGIAPTAESTTYRQKSGFSIDGEVYSIGTGGIVFRTSEGRLTARVPISELEESDIAADPKVIAYLKHQEQVPASAKAAAAAENVPISDATSAPVKTATPRSPPQPNRTTPQARAQPQIPPTPAPGDFLHDFASVLVTEDETPLRELQRQTFAKAGIPIVVVTIHRMSEYQSGASYIESFARRWFDTWGIGSQANNSGMLVLVSIEDRKARIELGAAWGRRFDEFSQRLMDQKMVPRFKEGAYGAGLLAAVQSLAVIAAAGPKAEPPGPSLTEKILENPIVKFNRENNPIGEFFGGSWILVLMTLIGIGCIGAGIFFPANRKAFFIVGGLLIGLAVLFHILIAILFLWGLATSKINRGGGYSGGGGGYSGGGYSSGGGGGGYSGGSSGGGGASGSW